MALTTLDPYTALLVVDLQNGLRGAPVHHPIEGVVERAQTLLDAFRKAGLPVVLINVTGGAPGRTEQPPRLTGALPEGFADFMPELDRQPGDIVVDETDLGRLRQHESRRPSQIGRRDPGGDDRHRHRHRRGVDRSPSL